jgi:hypothetical protein
MRHLLLAVALALLSLLAVQVVATALEISAARPQDDSDFVPGVLPKAAIGAVPIGARPETAKRPSPGPERMRPAIRPAETPAAMPAPEPRSRPANQTPPSLRLPAPPATAPPGMAPRAFDDRA